MSDYEQNPINGGQPPQGDSQPNTGYTPYQQPGTYYTPPQPEQPQTPPTGDNGTTYHYAYHSGNQPGAAYNGQQAGAADHTAQAQPTGQTYGTPTEPPEPGKAEKKKNKKTITIVVSVLVVCVVIAVTGIVLAATGVLSGDKEEKTDGTSTSQDSGSDTQTVSGGSVATKDDSGNLTVAGVAKKAMDSCVGITVYSKQNSYSNFYGYGSNSSSDSSDNQQASGEGSGVIMKEANGKTYIMTCAHVIADGSSFKVTLNNGKEYTATMVGADSQTDIGVLSIEATGLQAATFADSKSLTVGEQVVAIGCPGGLEFKNSVTSGYISALDRPVESSIGYDNECIQTDAAINPGNSGGALFNMQGQVIGINSSKIASTEYEGMGFAVPSSTAVDTANSLIKNGYVAGRAKIGVTYNTITSYNNADAILSALTEKGFKNAKGTMVINQVSSDSDLAGKQVKQYDMIVAVNGKTMTSTDVMTQVLSDSKPGDTIKLTIARIEGNQIKTFKVDCKLIESKGNYPRIKYVSAEPLRFGTSFFITYCLQLGDHFHLAQHTLGQVLNGHAGAGRLGGKVGAIHLIELGKIRNICQETNGLYCLIQRSTGSLSHGFQVLTHLASLGLNGGGLHIAGGRINGDLATGKQQIAGFHRLAVRTDGAGCVVGAYIFHNHSPLSQSQTSKPAFVNACLIDSMWALSRVSIPSFKKQSVIFISKSVLS